jgi:hypothetical protein
MPLDRIPEHRARHSVIMFAQESVEHLPVPLSNLAQHPPDRLVNQIVRVVQQQRGDPQRGRELVALDEVESRDNGDPPLPHVLRAREAHE